MYVHVFVMNNRLGAVHVARAAFCSLEAQFPCNSGVHFW